jgi:hypothetical protein
MLEMLAALTPAERQTLKDPNFITEDEADLIWSDRGLAEPGESVSVDELFAELGIPRRRRSANAIDDSSHQEIRTTPRTKSKC